MWDISGQISLPVTQSATCWYDGDRRVSVCTGATVLRCSQGRSGAWGLGPGAVGYYLVL